MENQTTKKIRRGDRVIAISGNNKGLIGTVQSRKGETAIVQGLNLRKKHVKKSQEAPKGRIVEIERPIHISNLKVCDESGNKLKLKTQLNDQGNRQFVYEKNGQEIVYRSVKHPVK